MLVGLYPQTDTLSVFEDKPKYFTRTEESGQFIIKNVKYGYYRIYAFVDKNKDRLLQTNSESYAFAPEVILPTDTTSFYDLTAINLNNDTLNIRTARTFGPFFDISFTKPFDSLIIRNIDDSLKTLYQSDKDQQRLRLYSPWINKEEEDSIQIRLKAKDSIHFKIDTILYAKFKPSKRKGQPIKIESIPGNNQKVQNNPVVKLNFSSPIRLLQLKNISIFLDSLNTFPVKRKDIKWDSRKLSLSIKISLKPENLDSAYQTSLIDWEKTWVDKESLSPEDSTLKANTKPSPISKFKLIIPDSTVLGANGEIAPETIIEYSFQEESTLSTLYGTVKPNDYDYYIMQLIDDQGTIVKELTNPVDFRFERLLAKTYQIRILIDTNNDGIWSLGNLLRNIPPDAVQLYRSNPIELRENFIIDLETIELESKEQVVDNGE